MTYAKPQQWLKWLSLVEWWYNTNYHKALEMTSIQALYGYAPPQLDVDSSAIYTTSVDEWLKERELMLSQLRINLQQSQSRMKQLVDNKRTKRVFQVGDMAFLKIQSYKQTSVALRKNLKLCSKYYGPYEVEAKVGAVAYRLKLPAQSHIHPIFHVSQLKKSVSPQTVTLMDLPTTTSSGECLLSPVVILDTKVKYLSSGEPITKWLIQWLNLGVEEATWEPVGHVLHQFPSVAMKP